MDIFTRFHRGFRSAVYGGAVILPAMSVNGALIDIQSTGTLDSNLVRLADVADILDSDPQVQHQLENIVLAPAPAPGRKLKITQQMIRERLLAYGVNLTEIEFTGQSMVLLEAGATPVSQREETPVVGTTGSRSISKRSSVVSPALQQRAEEIVKAAFQRHYHSPEHDTHPLTLDVEIADIDVEHLLRADPEQVRFHEPGLRRGGPQTLTAHIVEVSGAPRVVKMQAWLNDTPHIVTVKHTVPKGQVIQESDLVRTPAKPGQMGIEHPESLIGKEAVRHLNPGSAVQHSDLAKIPLVRSNDLVTIKARSGGISVSRSVRAVANGAEGDVIFFTALDNPREKIQARVTGWHEAEIVEVSDDGPDMPRGRSR